MSDSSYSSSTTKPIYRVTQVIWYLLGLAEALLAFRFILKLLGANPLSGFVSFIYGVTYPLAIPFLTAFRITQVQGVIVEWTTLLAMLVYLFLAWAIIKLFLMSRSVSTPEAAQKLNQQEQK